jgi:hypothetical protein
MAGRVVYDGSAEIRRDLPRLIQQRVTLVCPKCGAELIVALDADGVSKHKVHPGVYCSIYPMHFFEIHELR